MSRTGEAGLGTEERAPASDLTGKWGGEVCGTGTFSARDGLVH